MRDLLPGHWLRKERGVKCLPDMWSAVWRCCAAICLAAASVCAQSQPALLLLEIKECGELQIFDDGMVVESGDGKKAERRLSSDQMRKVRKVIEHGPCEEQWRKTARAYAPGEITPELLATAKVDISHPDCLGQWMGAPFGLREVLVNRHYPDHQTGFLPVYIKCEKAKGQYKKHARRSLKNSKWPRFFSNLDSALGGKSLFTRCKCGWD
jgi:hypothetical protein